MDHSNSSTATGCDPSHPFLSVWDRLDALSIREHRRVQAYHETVRDQNDQLHKALARRELRGRLRRQNSWNGRDSQRNLHVAQNSIIAEVDDCSLRHLLSVLDGEKKGPVVYDHRHDAADGTEDSATGMGQGVIGGKQREAQSGSKRCNEYVMNLVL